MSRFKFCPKCGGKLIDKKTYLHKRPTCNKCGFIFYQDPSPTVGVFPIKNNQVLLAKRAIEPFKGWWDSIGGFMERGESPHETAVRETKEETGLDVKITEILGVGKDRYEKQYTVPIAFLGEIADGELKAADDVEELKWFDLEHLPSNIAFEGNKKILRMLKQKYRR